MNHTLKIEDISELESIMLSNKGLIKPVFFNEISKFTQQQISFFCWKYALYQVPTVELLWFLDQEAKIGSYGIIPGNPKVLEIGAGNGCIGRYLHIKMVDNYMQTFADVKHAYNRMQQPTISYGLDVEKVKANYAIIKYKPEIVIGCWISQAGKYLYENPYGVDEIMMFEDGIKKYIHVGNELTHNVKLSLLKTMKVKTYKFPWLISRSMSRDKNIIYVFEK